MSTSTELEMMDDIFVKWSETKQVGFIQRICDRVKRKVERETGVNYEEFSAVEYRSQFVEVAVKYLIKVHVGGADYDHLLVSQEITYPVGPVGIPIPPPVLLGVQQHKTKKDRLKPFPPSGTLGEWSGTKDATEETQKICHLLKDQVERETGVNYQEFTAIKYSYQDLLEGENFLIKVRVGGADYDHLLVSRKILFESFDGVVFPPVLLGVLQHKTREDHLEPFPPTIVTEDDILRRGWSKTKDATEDIQKICHEVKDQVEKKTGVNYQEFTAVEYRNQMLYGGENFLIKVRVGGADYDHLLVSRELYYEPVEPPIVLPVELRGVEQHKTKEDPLEPFPPNVVPKAYIFAEWTPTKDATEDTQKICDEVKGQVEKKTGVNYKEFTAVVYRSQLVEGENFLIKVHVGVDYDHLSVFRALPCNGGQVELRGVLQHKTREDPLEPFPPNISVGGWSKTKDATEEIQRICDEVKGQVEKKTGVNYKEFTAVEYRIQVVEGENFLIKVRVGADYDHLSVFRALRYYGFGKVGLCGVLQHKTKKDPLEPFTN